MIKFNHIPVMLNECINELNIKPNGTYIDGTIGGAGHSYEIAKRLGDKGLLIGVDKDKEALKVSAKRLNIFKNRIKLVNDDYKNIKQITTNLKLKGVDGILLDFGVSSYQLDTPERGFSYRFNAPLDMRMDKNNSLTAYEVVNNYTETKLIKILFEYGEESFARSIVKKITDFKKQKNIETTFELAEIVKSAIPKKLQGAKSVCTKTFQAIRIEVNKELENLESGIKEMVEVLNSGGRLAIITFHSLEDRIVKNVFNELSTNCICDKRFPVCICNHKATVKLINKKPIIAGVDELNTNKRSSSAKLRVLEKL